MNDYGSSFPVDASLKSYTDAAKKEKSEGKIEDCNEVKLGKAKGILRIEKTPSSNTDPQRITFQGYFGSIGINIVASSAAKDFLAYQSQLESIVRSCKWE